MATVVQITTQVSPDELLHGVEQLSLPDLEQFVWRVLALQAQRKAPGLPHNETELLLKINRGLPAEMQRRYDELVARRKAETITPDELQELLRLVDHIEKSDVQRVKHLVELANLRGISMSQLMQELNIRPPAYA
ncbi:MAG: STAS/SEC14 domain-containing protein [Chloroflexota bacterium]